MIKGLNGIDKLVGAKCSMCGFSYINVQDINSTFGQVSKMVGVDLNVGGK